MNQRKMAKKNGKQTIPVISTKRVVIDEVFERCKSHSIYVNLDKSCCCTSTIVDYGHILPTWIGYVYACYDSDTQVIEDLYEEGNCLVTWKFGGKNTHLTNKVGRILSDIFKQCGYIVEWTEKSLTNKISTVIELSDLSEETQELFAEIYQEFTKLDDDESNYGDDELSDEFEHEFDPEDEPIENDPEQPEDDPEQPEDDPEQPEDDPIEDESDPEDEPEDVADKNDTVSISDIEKENIYSDDPEEVDEHEEMDINEVDEHEEVDDPEEVDEEVDDDSSDNETEQQGAILDFASEHSESEYTDVTNSDSNQDYVDDTVCDPDCTCINCEAERNECE